VIVFENSSKIKNNFYFTEHRGAPTKKKVKKRGGETEHEKCALEKMCEKPTVLCITRNELFDFAKKKQKKKTAMAMTCIYQANHRK
jgi:hypothetical protein